jgi:hypothetical protein
LQHGDNGLTTWYWPHFTLQPSLIDASVFRDESLEFRNVRNFEKDFAHQYTDKGWKTAFVQQHHTTIHIGKNMGDTTCQNAYELNNVIQY